MSNQVETCWIYKEETGYHIDRISGFFCPCQDIWYLAKYPALYIRQVRYPAWTDYVFWYSVEYRIEKLPDIRSTPCTWGRHGQVCPPVVWPRCSEAVNPGPSYPLQIYRFLIGGSLRCDTLWLVKSFGLWYSGFDPTVTVVNQIPKSCWLLKRPQKVQPVLFREAAKN